MTDYDTNGADRLARAYVRATNDAQDAEDNGNPVEAARFRLVAAAVRLRINEIVESARGA